MISNYVRPQLTIEQILETTPAATKDRLTAVVIGRQYLLSRYNKEDNVYGVTFSTTGFTGGATAGIPLKVWNSTTEAFDAFDSDAYTPTTANTSVYVENGEATLYSTTSSAVLGRGYFSIQSSSAPNVLVLDTDSGKFTASTTGALFSGLAGRNVTVGDIFYVKGSSADADFRRRTVTDVTAQELTFSGPLVSSTFTTPVSATIGATASGASVLTLGSTAGLTVNMPIVSIGGASGSFSDNTYITAIGSTGVTLNAAVTGASGAAVGFSNVIYSMVLTAPVTDQILSTDWDLDADNDQVTIAANASVTLTDRNSGSQDCALRDGKGTLYPSFKALKTVATTEGIIPIDTVSDIVSNLGTIDLDNELAFGANECLSGANGKSIYALRVSADNTTEYAKALRKIESTDSVYALCPLTEDTEVQLAVASHCASMSAKDVKNFRRCYVGTDSPGEYVVQARGTDGTTKLLVDVTVAGDSIFADLTNGGTIDLTTLSLTEGDLLKVIDSNGAYTGDEYEIEQITDSNSMYLTTGPTVSTSNIKVEFWKADSSDSQIKYVKDISQALANRRAANVWVENGTRIINGVSTVIPNKYVAAEVCGLRTAVVAWQGLTMTEITSVTDAPAMYTRYTRDQLNDAASYGVFIVTQEAESASVFIRHQLTTKTDAGSLSYEDSVGTSLDFISLKVKDVLAPYIGRKNVTQQTINEIYNDVWNILNDATTTDAGASYGPQLNGFEDKAGERGKVTVAAHATLKDRVTVYAKLLMPLPLNNLEVVLDASVDFSL